MTAPSPSTPPQPNLGAVVSDLHLFSPRSDGDRLFAKLEPSAAALGTLVLNGDTFDFRWSRFPSEAASIAAAEDWLGSLLGRHPDLQIHYLLGNHDCLTRFRPVLEHLSANYPNFHTHDQRLVLGDQLFLHGDCANRRMDGRALDRFRSAWSRDRPRGRTSAACYSAVDSIGISKSFHNLYFPGKRTVSKVAYHLDHVLPTWRTTIRDCYFGHTHRPVHGIRKFGVRFYNTGSAIRGMGFAPRTFHWDPGAGQSRSTLTYSNEPVTIS